MIYYSSKQTDGRSAEVILDLREKIIHTAYKLFAQKGFEKTTVNDIIHEAGASKGGFYHHFESKDAVMEAITLNLTDEVISRYHEIRDANPTSAIDEFNNVFMFVNQAKTDRVAKWNEFNAIYSFSKSHIFIRKMAERFEKSTAELYKSIIDRGVEEGVFNTNHPNHLAGMWTREILRLYSLMPHIIIPDGTVSKEEFISLLDYSETLINRELGTNNEIKVKQPALDFIDVSKEAYIKLIGGNADD